MGQTITYERKTLKVAHETIDTIVQKYNVCEEGMDCQHSLMEEIEQVTEMFKIPAEAAQKLDQSR